MMEQITEQQFKRAVHPKENSRFILALIICVPILIVALILTFVTAGTILLFIGLIAGSIWLTLRILKANLIANSIRVSKINFPEVYKLCEEIKVSMDYKDEIQIFIIDEGGFNAFLHKFLRTRFIILTSSLLADMTEDENLTQLKWIIARFIGSLRTKQYKTDFVKILIESIDSIKVFSFFILPYERATQYTGDNIGLLACKNVEQVLLAFDKFLVGSKLSQKIHFEGIIEQGREVHNSFFALIARLLSSYPHNIDRHLNLLAFARKEFPDQFERYISKYDSQTTLDIGNVLPSYD